MDSRRTSVEEKRTNSSDELQPDEYFGGPKKRFYNATFNAHVIKIFAGEWAVSKAEDEMLATILGSCVSACVRDPVAGIGGMNHFLLPGDESSDRESSDGARYGVNAMENLINGLLKAGAQKHRLEFKVFGGGNVINNSARIGSKNAKFVQEFLKREGYRIVSQDLEGDHPRSLHYYPVSGKVMMRVLRRKQDYQVVEEEDKYRKAISKKPIEGDIELF
jgi:chemotaxis protein CheD